MLRNRIQRRFLPVLPIVAGFFLASLACYDPPFLVPTATPTATDTPTPTPTQTPTVTPTPTATFTPTVSYLDWPLVLSDSFDDNANGWFMGDWNTGEVRAITSIGGGKLHLTITSESDSFWWFPTNLGVLKDFYLSVEMQKMSGPAESNYGIIFRNGSEGTYYFSINADHRMYRVALFNNDEWTDLIEWTQAPQIHPDSPNQLAMKAAGSRFLFFINGEELDQAEDATLPEGIVGGGIALYHAGDTVELEIDNLEVRVPRTAG
jgi:hypothetical protein